MNIPVELSELIDKKKLKKFSHTFALQVIIDILSSKNSIARNSLISIADNLHKIDTALAIEFTKLYKTSFLFQNTSMPRVVNNYKDTDWNEEVLFDYNTDKFIRQPNVQKLINTVIKEHQKLETLREYELEPISKLLLDGKSGVGKTECAKEIAYRMGLPLYTLDLATIFDSHLGATGAKLKKVIEFANSHECVFLLDEFDAIASARNTDKNDVGETKRITNVLLKLIETWNSSSILICATNHIEAIDSAMLRRFDKHVKFELPSNEEISQIVDYRFGKLKLHNDSKKLLLESFVGKSHGVIINECNSLIKESILDESCIDDTIQNYIKVVA